MNQNSDISELHNQTIQYEIVVRNPESILKKQLGDDVSVVDFESESFLKTGENYGSTMKAITVSVKRKNEDKVEKLHLIAKLLPPTDFHRRIFGGDHTFEKEIFFYERLIPIYQDLYEKEFKIAPQYYGSRQPLDPDSGKINEDAVILLENLKLKGYYMLDRYKGLDLEHLNVAIPAIAKFHAIGLSIKNKKPSFLPGLEKYNTRLVDLEKVYIEIIDKMLAEMKILSEVNKYHARIKALYDNTKDSVNFFYEFLKQEDPWACISHLDLWNNNMLFHRDEEGTIDDVKIVDFQTYAMSIPLTDLIFLLCSSMQYPLEHFDPVVELYRETACKILDELNIDPCLFTKQQFEERLKIDAIRELFHLIVMINIVECREGDDILKRPANKYTIRRLKRVFEIYEQKKWL